LSALYPATIALYRRAGYELAGHYCRFKVELGSCPRRGASLELRPVTDADRQDVVQAYRTVARGRTGHLERGPYVWNRVRSPRGELARGYVVVGDQGLEGYVFLVQQKQEREFHYDLALSDFVAVSGRALDRLLRFFADHRSMADHAIWYGGPTHPALFAMPDRGYEVRVSEQWMLRLVHVEQALGERGYPDVDLELMLEVKDDILTENTGSYYLQIKHGGAGVEPVSRRGGGSTVARAIMDVRTLAALYSGFSSAEELARSGAIEADGRTLSALSLLFNGPPPSMCDFF
jgi:predicted acetyltransferase